MERGCGILLPIASLPNNYGYGCFSREAYDFVDFLSDLNMKYWQILPLGGVDNVGSPYSSVSAFAGEPLYIDIERFINKSEIEFFMEYLMEPILNKVQQLPKTTLHILAVGFFILLVGDFVVSFRSMYLNKKPNYIWKYEIAQNHFIRYHNIQ